VEAKKFSEPLDFGLKGWGFISKTIFY